MKTRMLTVLRIVMVLMFCAALIPVVAHLKHALPAAVVGHAKWHQMQDNVHKAAEEFVHRHGAAQMKDEDDITIGPTVRVVLNTGEAYRVHPDGKVEFLGREVK